MLDTLSSKKGEHQQGALHASQDSHSATVPGCHTHENVSWSAASKSILLKQVMSPVLEVTPAHMGPEGRMAGLFHI